MQIIKQLVEISLRKREPQDLDYNLHAAILLTFSVVLLRYIVFRSSNSFSNPFAYGLVSVIGESLVIYALLRSQDKASRFVQTITALFGITMILALVFGITVIATQTPAIMMIALILLIALPVLMIWSFYLMVLILRAALDCSFIASLMLTIGYSSIGALLVSLLFPEYQAEMQAMLESIRVAMEAAQLEAQSR